LSLFQKASQTPRRLKAYIYGESGTGKTVTSLQFPNPVVVDMERGTEHYAGTGKFKFDVLRTTSPTTVKQAIDELIKEPLDYKTLVIDPITVFYDQVMDQHILRKRKRSGNPSDTLAPLDYKPIHGEMKNFINKLIALDMNIIITAHSATMYSNDPGEFMKIVGTKPDGYKKLPYMMDVVLELTIAKDGKRIANVIKDRTNKLPDQFEFTYNKMAEYFGIDELERSPVQFTAEQALEQLQERNFEIVLDGKTLKTAGVTAETLTAINDITKTLNIKPVEILDKLQADYGVQSLLALKEDEAVLLLHDIKNTNQA